MVLCDKLGVNEDEVKADSLLIEDLGADSLDIVEIVMLIENKGNLPKNAISDEEWHKIHTFRDGVDCAERYLGDKLELLELVTL